MEKLTDKVAKLSKNSSNSSKPPSSDIVKPPRKKKGNGSRNIGGQPRHTKHERTPFAKDQIDAFQTHTLDCPDCGGKLKEVENSSRVVQQVEIVKKPIRIEQHTGLCYWCEHCQKSHYAPKPENRSGAILGRNRMGSQKTNLALPALGGADFWLGPHSISGLGFEPPPTSPWAAAGLG